MDNNPKLDDFEIDRALRVDGTFQGRGALDAVRERQIDDLVGDFAKRVLESELTRAELASLFAHSEVRRRIIERKYEK